MKIDYVEGDTISVKKGIKDPDLGPDISGWCGIADSIYDSGNGQMLVEIHWDSITLNNMELSQFVECQEQELDWSVMVLGVEEVHLSKLRDHEEDVTRIKEEIQEKLSGLAQ